MTFRYNLTLTSSSKEVDVSDFSTEYIENFTGPQYPQPRDGWPVSSASVWGLNTVVLTNLELGFHLQVVSQIPLS